MSLVGLAHVCSHLQNASLARLGLTSIPYTKLHLSLALLLHKQGFLSQVKVAGKAPPASCFPAALPDNRRITAAPHRDRSTRSREAALADVVIGGKTLAQLSEAGYPEDAIAFAQEARELTKEQLEADGWDLHAIDFVMEHANKDAQQLEEEGLPGDALEMMPIAKEKMQTALSIFRDEIARDNQQRAARSEEWIIQYARKQNIPPEEVDRELVPDAFRPITEDNMDREHVAHRIRAILRHQGFSIETLQFFAGPARFATARHLEQDGITVSAMGLTVPNQPVTLLPEAYRDAWDEETEGVVTPFNRASRRLWLGMKYWDGQPVLRKASLISKPTKRLWLGVHELGKVVRGSPAGEVKGMRQVGEIMAISTDKGVMEARECVERRIGGQALCRIW